MIPSLRETVRQVRAWNAVEDSGTIDLCFAMEFSDRDPFHDPPKPWTVNYFDDHNRYAAGPVGHEHVPGDSQPCDCVAIARRLLSDLKEHVRTQSSSSAY